MIIRRCTGLQKGGHDKVLKTLFEYGATVDIVDVHGYVPLHWAARHGHNKVLKTLLENGAKVDAQITKGMYKRLYNIAFGCKIWS